MRARVSRDLAAAGLGTGGARVFGPRRGSSPLTDCILNQLSFFAMRFLPASPKPGQFRPIPSFFQPLESPSSYIVKPGPAGAGRSRPTGRTGRHASRRRPARPSTSGPDCTTSRRATMKSGRALAGDRSLRASCGVRSALAHAITRGTPSAVRVAAAGRSAGHVARISRERVVRSPRPAAAHRRRPIGPTLVSPHGDTAFSPAVVVTQSVCFLRVFLDPRRRPLPHARRRLLLCLAGADRSANRRTAVGRGRGLADRACRFGRDDRVADERVLRTRPKPPGRSTRLDRACSRWPTCVAVAIAGA